MKDQSFIYCDRQRIDLNAIIWLEGDSNYTRIYQSDRPVRLSAYTLKWYENQLTDFIRIRKGAMVNPQHIVAIQKSETKPKRIEIVLSNEARIEVARRRHTATKKRFKAVGERIVEG